MIDKMPFYQSRLSPIMIDKASANHSQKRQIVASRRQFVAMAESRPGFRWPA